MLNTKEKEQILNAYHKKPEAMGKLVDSPSTSQECDICIIKLLLQMTPEERKLILTTLRKKG